METLDRAFHNASDTLRRAMNAYESNEEQSLEQHGEEPLSGVQGRGTATDPYDAGNRDEQPGAPHTQANTAVTTEPLVSITPLTPIEQKSSDLKSANSGSGNQIGEQRSAGQEDSNTTASSSGQSSAQSNNNNKDPAPEQREQTMSDSESGKKEGEGKDSSGDEGYLTHDPIVSVEALKGPQGGTPREPYEFEKDPQKALEKEAAAASAAQDEHHRQEGSHHSRTLGNVKERFGRVLKAGNHLHHKNK